MNDEQSGRALFRRNLVRVLAVQVIALVLLWLLQTRYAPDEPTRVDEVGMIWPSSETTVAEAFSDRAQPEVPCIL